MDLPITTNDMPGEDTLAVMNGVLGLDSELFLSEFNSQAPVLEKLFAHKATSFIAFMIVALNRNLIKAHSDIKQEGTILTLSNNEYTLNYEFILHNDGSVTAVQKLDYVAMSTVIANKEISLKDLSLVLSRLVKLGMHMTLIESKPKP